MLFHISYMECIVLVRILCGDEAMVDGPGHLERERLFAA